jgi:hypothetical protein
MKINSDGTCERTRKLLVIAQLMILAFSALGLAVAFNPTPVILFLFTSVSPALALPAVIILVTQWIATYKRREIHQVIGLRANRTDTKGDRIAIAERAVQVDHRILGRACEGVAVEVKPVGYSASCTIERIL